MPRFLPAIFILVLAACSGGGGGNANTARSTAPQAAGISNNAVSIIEPVPVIQSPLSASLVFCTVNAGCSLNRLPILGMETPDPTIDDVMARVLVSHDWMGNRFRDMLGQMPPEITRLTRGLTAIVISYEIRPSYYDPGTGAIYLDPDGMWLTSDEREVISTEPDFRVDFGSELQFTMLWRYVIDHTNLRNQPRSLETISQRTAALLFHELAHANDFFPPGQTDFLNRTVPIIDAIEFLQSSNLIGTFPLRSSIMSALADVSFRGQSSTLIQRNLTADDIAVEFPMDVANDFYNYSSQFEDLAMLFEEAMMFYSYGISRDVAVTNLPPNNDCDQYIVAWGQRNRIADPAVQVRAALVVRALLPEIADQVEESLVNMPGPTPMNAGLDWCTNISLVSSNPRAQVRTLDIEHLSVERLIPYQ